MMKVLYFTNEYPPLVYGGAGVHIEYLSKEVSRLAKVEVRCYGDQKLNRDSLKATGYEPSAFYPNLDRGL